MEASIMKCKLAILLPMAMAMGIQQVCIILKLAALIFANFKLFDHEAINSICREIVANAK